MKTYCIVCKKTQRIKIQKFLKQKNGRLILKSVCSVCNNKKVDLFKKIEDLVYYQVLVSEHFCQKYQGSIFCFNIKNENYLLFSL